VDFVVVLALAGLIVGLSKGGLGAPLGAVIAPMLAITFPVSEAVGLTLPLLIIGDAFAIAAYWRAWNMRYIWWLLPAALVGIVIGTLLLVSLDNRTLKSCWDCSPCFSSPSRCLAIASSPLPISRAAGTSPQPG